MTLFGQLFLNSHLNAWEAILLPLLPSLQDLEKSVIKLNDYAIRA